MTILLVDDKPNLARVTTVALSVVGCQSLTAGSIGEALALLDTKKIDAVFLDVNLGGENGLEFLSQLRSEPGRPPVIIFTSHSRSEIAEEARDRGAFDCLIKPFTLDDLRDIVARLEQHRIATGPAHDPIT